MLESHKQSIQKLLQFLQNRVIILFAPLDYIKCVKFNKSEDHKHSLPIFSNTMNTDI